MQLYGPLYSPFVARVRIVLRLKGISHEHIRLPAGGLTDPAFLALNPIGRVPVLVLDDGTALAESETIVTFLDEGWPEPRLLPVEAMARARVRTVIRATDNYLTPATERLYPFRDAFLTSGVRDEAGITTALGELIDALAIVDRLIVGRGPSASLTLADCMVFPSLYLVELVTGQLGLENILGRVPHAATYFATAKQHPLLGQVYREALADLVE